MNDSIKRVCLDGILARDLPYNWIIEGWLHEMDYAILAGKQYSGKSTIAMFVALSVASGRTLSPMLEVLGGPRKVLYIDEEMRIDDAERRLQRMMKAHAVTEEELAGHFEYWVGNGTTIKRLETRSDDLKDAVNEYKPDLVVLDSLSAVAEGNLNDAEVAGKIGRLIRRFQIPGPTDEPTYKAGILAVHHMRKHPAGDTNPTNTVDDVAGSYKLTSDPDTVWQAGWEGEQVGRLTPKKVRALPRRVNNKGVSYLIDKDTNRLMFEEVKDV